MWMQKNTVFCFEIYADDPKRAPTLPRPRAVVPRM
jgi:hypothetical protein